MERAVLTGQNRKDTGKGAARKLRNSGIIPCVMYKKGDVLPIQINRPELVRFVNSTMGEQRLVDIKLEDGSSKIALLKDYQKDPAKGDLLHVDFYEISLTHKLKVSVAIALMGTPVGVKRDAGILNRGVDEIEIECMPDDIPPHIEVDVASLEIGHAIHVSDIHLKEGIKILSDPHELIATVALPAKAVSESAETAGTEESTEK